MARRRRDPYTRHGFGSAQAGTNPNMTASQALTALREMGEHVVNAAKRVLKDGADIIVAEAKSRCPVKTGRLRESIKATPKYQGTVYEISANASKTDSHGRTYYYGGRVEFDPTFGNPFLYPAFDAHSNEIYHKVRDAISNAIRSRA